MPVKITMEIKYVVTVNFSLPDLTVVDRLWLELGRIVIDAGAYSRDWDFITGGDREHGPFIRFEAKTGRIPVAKQWEREVPLAILRHGGRIL